MSETIEVEMKPKPCPFCGSTDIRIDKCTARARCKNCFATSGMISRLIAYGVKEDIAPLVAWNTRYAEDNGRRENGNY